MRRPGSSTRCSRSSAGATWSWSTSRPTRSSARCWRGARSAAGVVYTLAYGDQPALICELVEWARLSGFEVVCAGKGTKHLPAYHEVTPATGVGALRPAARADRGPQRARCSARSSTARSRRSRWRPSRTPPASSRRRGDWAFRPAVRGELAAQLRPAGGRRRCSIAAARSRSSRACTPDGTPVAGDLRWGVYVTVAAADRYVAGAFAAYGVATSRDGRVAALWRPSHLVGLELGVSVARAALAGEPTGVARGPDRGGRVPCEARPARRRDDRRRGRRARLRHPPRLRLRIPATLCRWDSRAVPGSSATSPAAPR